MTVKRVREIFGEKVAELTDEELTSFITNTSTLCDGLLQVATNSLTRYNSADNLNGK